MEWKLAEAKNKFSEVVNRALTEGPQRVRRRKDSVVVLSEEEYAKLRGERVSLKAFLLRGEGPSLEGVDLERSKGGMRDVEL